MQGVEKDKDTFEEERKGTGKDSFFEKIEHNWLEILAAALLALATIMSASSAYNSARWHGKSTEYYNRADSAMTRSSELLDVKLQDKIIDATVLTDYLNAIWEGKTELADAYRARINPRLKVALEAWEKLNPRTNPEAPRTPFQMAEYKDEYLEASRKFAGQAEKYSSKARNAMHDSNDFILLTVLFAGVLFFAGISTKFASKQIKIVMLAFGTAVFLASVVIFALQPRF